MPQSAISISFAEGHPAQMIEECTTTPAWSSPTNTSRSLIRRSGTPSSATWGTIIAFRLGLPDAEILGKEFYPEDSVEDLIGLPNYQIYLKLMIDGTVSRTFSTETITPQDRLHKDQGGLCAYSPHTARILLGAVARKLEPWLINVTGCVRVKCGYCMGSV